MNKYISPAFIICFAYLLAVVPIVVSASQENIRFLEDRVISSDSNPVFWKCGDTGWLYEFSNTWVRKLRARKRGGPKESTLDGWERISSSPLLFQYDSDTQMSDEIKVLKAYIDRMDDNTIDFFVFAEMHNGKPREGRISPDVVNGVVCKRKLLSELMEFPHAWNEPRASDATERRQKLRKLHAGPTYDGVIHIDIKNSCRSREGATIAVRFFESIKGKLTGQTWPDASDREKNVYLVARGPTRSHSLRCAPNTRICYGAAYSVDGRSYWGLGLNGTESCSDCCYSCGSRPEIALTCKP